MDRAAAVEIGQPPARLLDDDQGSGEILSLPLAGGTPTKLATGQNDPGDISRRFRDGLIREKISKLDASLAAVETPIFILHLAYRTDTLNQAYQTGLMSLAATTGGSSYFCRSQTEIPDAMGKAFEAITSQYSLTVALPKALLRVVDVTLGSPGHTLSWRSRFALKGD